jgi:hypothetical protein
MSNARFLIKMKRGGQAMQLVMEKSEVPSSNCMHGPNHKEGRLNAGCVLSGLNKMVGTVTFIL